MFIYPKQNISIMLLLIWENNGEDEDSDSSTFQQDRNRSYYDTHFKINPGIKSLNILQFPRWSHS